jgi:hypothetical protein
VRSVGAQRSRRHSQHQGGQQRSQSVSSNGAGLGNGPARGNPFQLYQRYLALAQEAMRSEDRISAEGYYQHAEHYYRVANEGRESQPSDGQRPDGQRAGGELADGKRGEAQPTETSPPIDCTAVGTGVAPAEPSGGEEVFHSSSGQSVPGEQS